MSVGLNLKPKEAEMIIGTLANRKITQLNTEHRDIALRYRWSARSPERIKKSRQSS